MMTHWRTLRCSMWLGWQIDSNWANPWLFAVYVFLKPLAGSFLLVCMYWAAQSAADDRVDPAYLPFLYLSSAAFMVIAGVTSGMSSAVVSDRESYGMLKFIRISPARFGSYLVGRGLSRAGQACLGAVVTVGIGLLAFSELRTAVAEQPIAWGWLLVYLLTGTVMLVTLGLILASAVLNMARYGMFLGEGIAGTLYLLSGAVFPVSQLPPWLQPVSLLLPPTYWLEALRRAVLGPSKLESPVGSWNHEQLALALLLSTAALVVVAHVFFGWSARRAWRLGRYDQNTGN